MAGSKNAPYRHIAFFGEDFFSPSKNHSFTVLAGDKPPRIVGGYAQWQVIPRPLRRGLNIFQGYDPILMEVSVRFIEMSAGGAWLTDDDAGRLIEGKIAILEWMAGEGLEAGPSPLVWLSTFDGQGKTVPLIPFQYQQDSTGTGRVGGPEIGGTLNFGGGTLTPWVVVGMAWDENPIRNRNGYRVRQDATVTVQFYAAPGQSASNDGMARKKAVVFRSRAGADTPLLIARHEPTAFPSALADAIRDAPQNKALHLRSQNTKVKHGKKVYVPAGG